MRSTGDELLSAIDADPDDDAARRVYADWLLDQGDSRGELIHLQLAPVHDEPRIRTLIEQHRDALLGSFSAIARAFEIRRGFVAAVTIDASDVARADRVAVARLEELDVTGVVEADLLELLTVFQPRRELTLHIPYGAAVQAKHTRSGEPWDVLLTGVFEMQGFNIDNTLSAHPAIVGYVNR
ncbi:MAG TPA: TIGR02996 domain-containing protein [Kofleriaceae bacterium]|nr:TIGR02996 domain-containing protein [Kofleriaceae bacterium]